MSEAMVSPDMKGGYVKRIIHVSLAMLIITMLFVCGCGRKGDVGSEINPIRFYLMPLKDKEIVDKNAAIIKSIMESNTGLKFKIIPAKSYLETLEAFGKGEADIAFMGTMGYLLAHDWAKAEAYLKFLYGDVYTSYRGEILVKSGGPINKIEDLNGKTIVFSSEYSSSGYLYPLWLLHEKNIKPQKMIFAKGHIDAIEMLYNGKVDAAATYHSKQSGDGAEQDARINLIKKYPDIFSKLKIVALTEEIPNGPVALRYNIPQNIKSQLVGSLMMLAKTSEGRKALYDLYGMTGLTTTNDKDYDGVREIIKDLGKTIQEMVPGGAPYFKTYMIPGLD